MKPPYRIAIAEDDDEQRALLQRSVVQAGHQIVLEARSGEELVERCSSPDGAAVQLVITDVHMGALNGLEAATQLLEHRDIPFIIVSGRDCDDLIHHASACRALGFLVKPIRLTELKATIAIAAERFQELREFRSEIAVLQQALEERKIVERAKGILMRERALDESSAFNCLQQLARQHRQKLVEVAKSIILASQALHATPASP